MKISTQKISWLAVGFTSALLSGVPAIADDTELLLINPDPTQNPMVLYTNVLNAVTAAALSPCDTAVQDAIDNAELPAIALAGPESVWYRQTSQTHDYVDAARSG